MAELNIVYQRNNPASAIKTIAMTWHDDLQELTDSDFLKAVEMHRKRSPYWPTPALLLAAAAELKPNRPPVYDGPQALPAGRTPQGQAATIALAVIRKKITRAEADAFFHGDAGKRQEILQRVQ